MSNIVEQAPQIIAEASKSPLGVVSLALLALSVVGYLFFGDSSELVRVSMYTLMFSGYGLLCFTLIRRSSRLQKNEEQSNSASDASVAPDDMSLQPSQPTAIEVQRVSPAVSVKRSEAAKKIDTVKGRRRLAVLWYAWSSLLLATLVLQILFGRYGEGGVQALAWISVSLMPAISMVVTSQAVEARSDRRSASSLSLWRLCFSLSVAYLLLITCVIFLQPFFAVDPLKLQNASTLFLAPMQGLLLASMVYFLLSREEEVRRVHKRKTTRRPKNSVVEDVKGSMQKAPNPGPQADG